MKKIVLIDNDPGYVVPLKLEFEKAGYEVIYFDDSQKAREAFQSLQADLVLCEIELPQINGHALFKEIRSIPAWRSVPVIFLSNQKRVDDRIKSIELGVDDYILKPFSVEEMAARVKALFKEISQLNENHAHTEKGFSGNLTEMNLVDLIQTLELGKKSAILKLKHNSSSGLVYINNGEVVDSALENLPPDQALLRMFTWTVGNFYVEMTPVDRDRTINIPNKELITVGMRRINQWEQIKEGLPPLNAVLIKTGLNNFMGLSDEEKQLIASVEEKGMISEIIQKSHFDDLKALELIKGLMQKGYLKETDENYLSYTENYLAQLKEHASRSRTSSERAVSIISSFFHQSNDEKKMEDPPESERRQLPDRRRQARRRYDRMRESNNMHLTKAELLMIRERLV